MAVGAEYGATNFISAFAVTRYMLIDYANTGMTEVRMPYSSIIISMLANCVEILCMHLFLYKKILFKDTDKLLLSIIVVYFISLAFSTGRMAFFPAIIHGVYTANFFSSPGTMKNYLRKHFVKLSIIMLLFSIAFLGMGSLRENTSGDTDVNLSPTYTIATYIGAPLLALDMKLNKEGYGSGYFGEHTLREIYDYARLLGVPIPRSQFHEDTIYIGNGDTNVYTGFYYWIKDFSVLGAFIYAALLGYIFGICYYKKYRKENIARCYLSSYLYFAMLMMFFDDQFNSIWSVNLLFCLLILRYFQKRVFVSIKGN